MLLVAIECNECSVASFPDLLPPYINETLASAFLHMNTVTCVTFEPCVVVRSEKAGEQSCVIVRNIFGLHCILTGPL